MVGATRTGGWLENSWRTAACRRWLVRIPRADGSAEIGPAKLDNYLLSNGTLLNVKFTPATLAGDGGLNKLADFLQAFCKLKLQHIQFNVVNADTLREAQQAAAGLCRSGGTGRGLTAPSLLSCRRRFRMTLSAAPRISCEVIDTRADRARIFNLQRYSLNDGQGIRTVVFFKGCPHTCPWCANPNQFHPGIQTLRRESKCLRCTRCQQDVADCPSGAWEQIGRDVTLDNLLQEVLKDEVFFRASGGGVTPSGAKCSCRPGLPPAFSSACASGDPHRHRNRGRQRFLTAFLPVAEACNEVLFDFKIMEPGRRGRCCE